MVIYYFFLHVESEKPQCAVCPAGTFRPRLAAFQVLRGHVASSHWTAQGPLLTCCLDTGTGLQPSAHAVWFFDLDLSFHLYSSNKNTAQASSSPVSLWGPRGPRGLPALSTTSLPLRCGLCMKNHPIRLLSPRRLCSGARTGSHSSCTSPSLAQSPPCNGTCHVIFKLNYTTRVVWEQTTQLVYTSVPSVKRGYRGSASERCWEG